MRLSSYVWNVLDLLKIILGIDFCEEKKYSLRAIFLSEIFQEENLIIEIFYICILKI